MQVGLENPIAVCLQGPVRGCTEGQPESKLSGQLRCTTLLPSSSNFLKPNIPSPKIGLLVGNYEGSFIYWKLENI